jgi:hypothetical protein
MGNSSYPVGYGRPPVHSRFRKGQSGNPGGKPGPRNHLRENFETILVECLNASEEALRNVKTANAVESLARRIVVQALDGRASAQKLLLEILDRENGRFTAGPPTQPCEAKADMEETARDLAGEQYEEFRSRYDRAVAAGSVDDLLSLAEDFPMADEFPEAGNFSGNSEKTAPAECKSQGFAG